MAFRDVLVYRTLQMSVCDGVTVSGLTVYKMCTF